MKARILEKEQANLFGGKARDENSRKIYWGLRESYPILVCVCMCVCKLCVCVKIRDCV